MRKLFFLLAYGTYFAVLCVFILQEAQTGHADARLLLIAAGTLPFWGIPLCKAVYGKMTRRRQW